MGESGTPIRQKKEEEEALKNVTFLPHHSYCSISEKINKCSLQVNIYSFL